MNGLILCLSVVALLPQVTQAAIPNHIPRKRQSSASNAAILNAVNEVARQSLLTDEQFKFDFLNAVSEISSGTGGKTVAATATNFPALIGHGVAMTVGYISACGINLPHTHPRATEMNFAVSGQFQAGFFLDSSTGFVMHTVNAGQAAVFPQGSIHFEQNLSCEPATFVAVFNSADPGVQTVANALYYGLPSDILSAALGGLNITTIESMKTLLPKNPSLGIAECRRRCGL